MSAICANSGGSFPRSKFPRRSRDYVGGAPGIGSRHGCERSSPQERHRASGVSAEVEIAQELGKDYFLLKARKDKTSVKAKAAKASDKIYNWTWDNLKILIGGGR